MGTLALSGCSFTPVSFSEPTTPTSTPSVDPVLTLDPEFLVRASDGEAKTLPEGVRSDQRFSTPHLDGTLVGWFVGESLGAATAAQLDEDTPIRAPEGYELAAFTVRGGTPGFVETADHAATVAIRAGDRRIPVPALFGEFNTGTETYLTQWEMMSFCVPAGERIALEITDETKTIVIDLRTGVPLVDEAWKATTGFRERQVIECKPENATFERSFSTIPPPTLEVDTGTMFLAFQPDTLSGLRPWTPTQGWAPEGKQWLAVPMAPRVKWEGRVSGQLTLDVPASFLYLDTDGEHAAVSPPSITTDQITTDQAELVVVWPVSGLQGSGTISFNAVGKLEVDYTEDEGVPAQFTSASIPLEFTLTMTPAQR